MRHFTSTSQDGFTIVEVVIAMVLMSIILTTLGGLTFASARQAVVASDVTARESTMLTAVNRMTALPSANLAAAAGCVSTGSTNNFYRRCITVTGKKSYDSVHVTVTPMQRNMPATSVSILRSHPPADNPLCTTC